MSSRGKVLVALAEEKERNNMNIELTRNLRENPQMIFDLPIIFIEEDAIEAVNNNVQQETIPTQDLPEIPSDNVLNHVDMLISDDDCDNGVKTSLVPYSEHSDSASEVTSINNIQLKKKRKKRCHMDKSLWKSAKNQREREKGKQYLGRKKDGDGLWKYDLKKKNKTIKQRCKCNENKKSVFKCFSLSDEDRVNIFNKFWALNWNEKKNYVDSVIKIIPIKRPRDRKDSQNSRRSSSILYYLRKNDVDIRVCKTMFLHTLDINRMTLYNWKRDTSSSHCKKNVNKRKCNNSQNEKSNKNLESFVDLLPKLESHYCRKSTTKLYLLPEWRTKKELYDFYTSECLEKCETPLSICSFSKFLEKKNISLFQPKKDACEKCTAFKQGKIEKEAYELHQKKKEDARNEKNKDKEEQEHIFTMDLQAVLLAPKSNVSTLYYKTKLCVHNMCFYNLKTKEGYCYLWNETEGGLNAEEFSSIISTFLINKVMHKIERTEGVKIILYSDGCTYQNRNATLSNVLLNVAQLHNITIEQKFLELGHTQMEVDSMHSCIERQLKNRTIFAPAEYYGICKAARRSLPYDVTYLDHTNFKKFQDIQFFKTIRPGKIKGDPKVTDIRALCYTPDGSIFYKLRFFESWTVLPQRKNISVRAIPIENLQNFYPSRLKINLRKYNDLQDLKIIIPADYHEYYDNLPHQ